MRWVFVLPTDAITMFIYARTAGSDYFMLSASSVEIRPFRPCEVFLSSYRMLSRSYAKPFAFLRFAILYASVYLAPPPPSRITFH